MIPIEHYELLQRQSLPLEAKIIHSINVIRQWYEYNEGQVYIAFSGGKDSTVLLHLVRKLYPHVPAVFVDTGLEFPEIKSFVRQTPSVITLRPHLTFKEVLDTYGFPVISKEQAEYIERARTTNNQEYKAKLLSGGRSYCIYQKWQYLVDAPFKISAKCCDILKKKPAKTFAKYTGRKPYIGTMADDSLLRMQQYLRYGCNSFDGKNPSSRPLSIWTEADIWKYIKENNIPYSPIYDMGETNTGCCFCLFGVHLEPEPNRFQRMKEHHPKLYKYCINDLELDKVLNYINVKY